MRNKLFEQQHGYDTYEWDRQRKGKDDVRFGDNHNETESRRELGVRYDPDPEVRGREKETIINK